MFVFFQFSGANGDRLIEIGATNTNAQKFAIEELKERRRRDHKLDDFLKEQEKRPVCKRLQVIKCHFPGFLLYLNLLYCDMLHIVAKGKTKSCT